MSDDKHKANNLLRKEYDGSWIYSHVYDGHLLRLVDLERHCHSNQVNPQIGAPTYLVSPVDFAQNPVSLFLSLSRYKIKDTYATSQMLDHAMNNMSGKGFNMYELKNLMISTDTRPRLDICEKLQCQMHLNFMLT